VSGGAGCDGGDGGERNALATVHRVSRRRRADLAVGQALEMRYARPRLGEGEGELPAGARRAIESWIGWYNADRPHQAHGYRSPL
jgi:hypothetical protein